MIADTLCVARFGKKILSFLQIVEADRCAMRLHTYDKYNNDTYRLFVTITWLKRCDVLDSIIFLRKITKTSLFRLRVSLLSLGYFRKTSIVLLGDLLVTMSQEEKPAFE